MPICDFCADANPEWSYPCATFTDPRSDAQSVGDWLACAKCYSAIQAEKPLELVERGVKGPNALLVAQIARAAFARDYVRDLHAQFFAHRFGSPRRLHT